MAEITDPEGEIRQIRWAAEQTHVSELIEAYEHWYNWADANEWAAGVAFIEQIGKLAAGNTEAIEFLTREMRRYRSSRSKSSTYLYSAARDALLELGNQDDALAAE